VFATYQDEDDNPRFINVQHVSLEERGQIRAAAADKQAISSTAQKYLRGRKEPLNKKERLNI